MNTWRVWKRGNSGPCHLTRRSSMYTSYVTATLRFNKTKHWRACAAICWRRSKYLVDRDYGTSCRATSGTELSLFAFPLFWHSTVLWKWIIMDPRLCGDPSDTRACIEHWLSATSMRWDGASISADQSKDSIRQTRLTDSEADASNQTN